jgi:glycerol-3-phosphate acyltransferase PlsY
MVFLPAFCCILGHVYPVWLRFKGGQGVATTAGVFLALDPISAFIGIIVWSLSLKFSKISSVSSLLFVLSVFLSVGLRAIRGVLSFYCVLFALGVVCFIVLTHRSNIKRLFQGEEKQIGL